MLLNWENGRGGGEGSSTQWGGEEVFQSILWGGGFTMAINTHTVHLQCIHSICGTLHSQAAECLFSGCMSDPERGRDCLYIFCKCPLCVYIYRGRSQGHSDPSDCAKRTWRNRVSIKRRLTPQWSGACCMPMGPLCRAPAAQRSHTEWRGT